MLIRGRSAITTPQDPARTGLDHIGFKVESVDAVKRDMEFLIGENPHMKGRPWATLRGRSAAEAVFRNARSGVSISPTSKACISMWRKGR